MDYIINDSLIYDTESGCLRHTRVDDHEEVTLTPVLSRILLLLIEKQGELITRDEFFEKVWGAYGKTGSSNTLNQYIGTLRQILEHHLEMQCIVTVPKLGYMLSSDVVITSHTPEVGFEKQQDSATHNSENNAKIEKNPTKNITTILSGYFSFNSVIFVVILFSSIISMAFYYLYSEKKMSMANVYFIKNCPVYSEDKIRSNSEKILLSKEINDAYNYFELKCDEGDTFYFFNSPAYDNEKAGRYTMISECSRGSEKQNICISYRMDFYD